MCTDAEVAASIASINISMLIMLVCFQMRNMEVGDRRGSAEAVGDLVLTACCRRKALLAYFGEKRGRCEPPEELCDFCRDPKAVVGSCHTKHHLTTD